MGANPSREKSRHSSGDDTGPTMGTGLREGGDYDVYPPMLEGDRGVASYFNKDFDEEAPSLFRPLAPPTGDEKRTIPTYLKWIGGGKEVFVSGSFNDWKENIPMVKSRENFYTIVHLSEGTYQYKFYVDGQWKCDPNEPAVDSSVGSKNNMLKVTSADFEVFEALAMDSLTKEEQFSSSPGAAGTHSVTGLSGSPPGEYSQEMPSRSPNQSRHAGPPVLPPHLLQVILNKETPVHCEPTLLPEPNHVMLNHLYALSIKDGVMVLSAAHRYRKKYVTTLLYTPIG